MKRKWDPPCYNMRADLPPPVPPPPLPEVSFADKLRVLYQEHQEGWAVTKLDNHYIVHLHGERAGKAEVALK